MFKIDFSGLLKENFDWFKDLQGWGQTVQISKYYSITACHGNTKCLAKPRMFKLYIWCIEVYDENTALLISFV